jgi:hypothetical protein
VKRIVQPEILDALSPLDPRAVSSRQDLRRINHLMQNHRSMAHALEKYSKGFAPKRIVELGAGDGKFLLSVAQKISPIWPNAEVALLDLQKNVSSETLAGLGALGWHAGSLVADVFDWPANPETAEIVIANLFLHHFEDARLAELLRLISERATLFIAIEPRRAAWPWFCSRLLWAIGCNDVTRHDAGVSVRAGFSGTELSALWPDKHNWRFTESRPGWCSHLFIAQKTG